MTEEELKILTIDSFEEFEAGNSGSGFLLEEGSYDGAVVVGYSIVKANFEGKEKTQIQLLWQVKDEEGEIHTLRGNGWTISANEKSRMRIELCKWFGTQEWDKVTDILVRGGILIKHDDGSAHFELEKFIGKRGKLLITEKTSKKGAKYNVIAGISPVKKKTDYEFGEVPWFLVEGDDIIVAKLAEGVTIRKKTEEDMKPEEAPAPVFGATNAAKPNITQNEDPKAFMGKKSEKSEKTEKSEKAEEKPKDDDAVTEDSDEDDTLPF